MAEIAFLDAVRTYLAGPAGISPAFAVSGFAQPVAGDILPLLALSLSEVARVDIGLGGGTTEVTDGALQIISTIDLANPVLAGAQGFSLLDGPRTGLTLPHGGLIRVDAVVAALGPGDLTVTVDGRPRTLAAANPGADEYTADPQVGQLNFGAALPASGDLVAIYHIGIWERATTLVRGLLDLGCWDSDAAQLVTVSNAAVQALLNAQGAALPGLQRIALESLGEIAEAQLTAPFAQRRLARLRFEYEHIVDVPMSSGGVIARVATTTELAAFVRDPGNGGMTEVIETETDE